ncbi:integrase [Paenibacillus glucanolyticus]|uniref:Integrase n=1 Tax=Paenibacillus glucanolyticus TaxID=59843 RepID=A0A163I1E6_9BACL|nr:tyrosine-type recombinase/integrase [Paenibacillus glucanolyticus]KZS45746.1 integrase [Paenibacillus glucanolyticus]
MASYTKIPAKNKQGYKWICTLEGPPDPLTGKRRQIPRRGDTKKEAYDRAKAVVDALNKHGIDHRKVKKQTFEIVSKDWLKTYSKRRVKKKTIKLREETLQVLYRYIASKQIDKINHRDHQDILNDLDDQGYSRSRLLSVNSVANMVYKYAVKEKLRRDNPCYGAEIPTKALTVEEIENDPIEEKYFKRQELSEYLTATVRLKNIQKTAIFYLLTFSGMRSGELCSLKWPNINFDEKNIRITKTIYCENNNIANYELTPPKNEGSIRTVDIDPSVMNLLKLHQRKQQKFNMTYRNFNKDFHDEKFVFSRDNGYPFLPIDVYRYMKQILKKTKITKEASPHIFRHTHISLLAEAEVDLRTIMQRVGHTDAKTTLRIYTHVTEKMNENANKKINTHYSDILGIPILQET